MTPARLLIVEDEAIVARDLSNRLTRLGYTVIGTADSAAEALQLIADQRPALVLHTRIPYSWPGVPMTQFRPSLG